MNNELQNNIQLKAVKAWVKAGKKGTLEVSTGVGKTFMALHCLQSMPKNEKLHLFLAETTSRLDDLIKDINKFNKIFDVDILNDYNLQFQCYQTVYKWKNIDIGLVIADEIHNSLSKEYSNFYLNNNYDAIVGLSATVDRKTEYIIDGSIVNKGMLLDSIAPVCFKYTLAQSKEDGVGRHIIIVVGEQPI
jgi:superfamily II DNA or RNA helicase